MKIATPKKIPAIRPMLFEAAVVQCFYVVDELLKRKMIYYSPPGSMISNTPRNKAYAHTKNISNIGIQKYN